MSNMKIKRDNTKGVLGTIQRQTKERIRDTAQVMTEQAKVKTPVKFGHNRDSITWQWTGEFRARVFTESGYGAYLEFGTSRMAARPYFRPAFDVAIREVNGGALFIRRKAR